MIQSVLQTIDGRRDAALAMLKEFLRIPSVSAKPEHAPDMRRCATWLADQLRFAGLETSIMPTGGHPCVVAKNRHQPGRPTVLLYGHYDVQPPEPLDLWSSPPFEPEARRDEKGFDAVFARGAVDDKGQVWAHVEAILAWQANGGLPVNLTLLIEGEEEVGSANLDAFLQRYREDLRADVCVISDTGQWQRGVPAITTGLRGLVYQELFLTGPSHDLHSGGYGGVVPNPANELARLIASLHDDHGRVNLPGFYDDVAEATPAEREQWRRLPLDERQYLADLGLSAGSGEAGYSIIERTWVRPTCDVNGITAGYQGHGAKTVIASRASAKISFRLVPNQDPAKIREAFQRAMRERCPGNVRIEFGDHGAAPAVLTPVDSPAMRLAARAIEAGFGVPPALIRGGGSIPIVASIKSVLGIDTLLVGFGLPDDRVHSPDEKFDLDAFWRGARTCAVLYGRLAELPR